jgi:hypothetical protein
MAVELAPGLRIDVVVTQVPRPFQLAFDARGRLVVLGSGLLGNAAGEIYRLDLTGPLPIDASRAPRVVIPFPDEPRKIVFGSLAVDARSGSVFLGEENGNRIYRLGADQRLEPFAIGLNHLLGGNHRRPRVPELRRRSAPARARRRPASDRAAAGGALPSHQSGDGPRREPLCLRRLSAAGAVRVGAGALADPGGIVLDQTGALYVPEAAAHRIIRITPSR